MSQPTESLLEQLETGTHIINFITNTEKKGKDVQTFEWLRARLQLLESYWVKISKNHGLVSRENSELKKTHEYFTKQLYYAYEDKYIEAKAIMAMKMSAVAGPPEESGTASSTPTIQLLPQTAQLPSLQIPKFNGEQRSWESFKELFCSLVTDVKSVPNVQKLQRLLSLVEGQAKERLSGVTPGSSNFEGAWNILLSTYDNPRVKQADHLNRLLSMPPAKQRSKDILRLLDTVEDAKRCMSALDRPVDQWDDWFIHLVELRLDSDTKTDWAKSIESQDGFPTYTSLKNFLECRSRTLATSGSVHSESTKNSTKSHSQEKSSQNKNSSKTTSVYNVQVTGEADDKNQKVKTPCVLCQENHFISYCPQFVNSDMDTRWSFVPQYGLCKNCLRPQHSSGECPSTRRCRVKNCNQPHHRFLHRDKSKNSSSTVQKTNPSMNQTSTVHHSMTAGGGVTLLATAQVILETDSGESIIVRALLDPGSEVSFVSERVVQALCLSKRRSCTKISGVGGKSGAKAVGEVDLSLRSTSTKSFKLHFSALVLPMVTKLLPGQPLENYAWDHLQGLELADPQYFVPGVVDCLLGANIYSLLLLEGLRKGGESEPAAQNTVLGWVLTGPTGAAASYHYKKVHLVRCHHSNTSCCKLREDLKKFWEIEEVKVTSHLSAKDKECEEHYNATHTRDASGRYVLRLPFSKTPFFPGSFNIAKARLLSAERRFHKNKKEHQAYVKFMKEYVELNHMERIPDDEVESLWTYYIPHHAIFKIDGSGKIRVVFNASQEALNKLALNYCLYSGRKLQTNITTIIIGWRFFRFVFSADIVKMFRQFRIHHDDTDWLRIVWRESPEEAIQHFRLLTVTYGTACAPYQAIRTILQLASDERARYPLGSLILERGTYVDDAFAGADTLEEALEARQQLIDILRSAGMELDKWSSNDVALLSGLSDVTTQDRHLSEDEVVSTLGLQWKPALDAFCFILQPLSAVSSTKRGLLSVVARLFDPVGWLSPILIRAKMLIQLLWIQGCDWDQELDPQLQTEWTTFIEQLHDVETIIIPRFFGCESSSRWFLHGFCDASERAYAAALYFVTETDQGLWKSSLIIAKSKVAPIKSISIPRLELCGAKLLSLLIADIVPQLAHGPEKTFCWSDSTVTLAWLREHPSRWTTFIANRVSDIHTLVPDASWNHVVSEDNPADCASRGLSPNLLREHSLWWNGPDWLLQDWSTWKAPVSEYTSNLERKATRPIVMHVLRPEERPVDYMTSDFSSLSRLSHAFAYVLRWRSLPRTPLNERPGRGAKAKEIHNALQRLVRLVQAEYFTVEINCLKNNKSLPKRSVIRRCLPFLDENGILRVGGRLQNTALTFEEKHPAIIPLDSHLSTLIIKDAHSRTLHGGPQLVLSFIQRRFWIPMSRNKVRRIVRLCVRCTRYQGRPEDQQMAPLPSVRCLRSLIPFLTVGVDYAGPFPVRTSKGRGQRATKGYVCLFICLTTRAIHLEVVSDLTTKTFLDAFSRFTDRRGICHTVYSDNGTTFQGAKSELTRLFDAASSFSKDVADTLANDGVNWVFIPPRAPHFGGIWEAGVKSFKHHLKRVLGDATLTFEEFSTLTTKIEACLNSRPLSPFSSNPEDLTALTPGHFIIGAALKAIPDPSYFEEKLTVVERYKLTTVMRNHFWRRWQKEVLHQHQVRAKWLAPNTALKEGDLVLISDINMPPTKWPLARVLTLHQGRDGLPRVATLKTATSTFDRPLVKLIRLPVDTDSSTAGGDNDVMAGGPDDAASLQLEDSTDSQEDEDSDQ